MWGGVDHLQAVLNDAATDTDEAVIIKFKREGCRACGSTNERFAQLAEAYEGRALFFTVDFHACRKFCEQSGIRAVPCVHIYKSDELVSVMGLGPSKWDRFVDFFKYIVVADPLPIARTAAIDEDATRDEASETSSGEMEDIDEDARWKRIVPGRLV